MTCLNSVTTSTGKFTLHTDGSTRCQAKKKCKEMGQILAPIKNENDLRAIRNLQKNNELSDRCAYGNAIFSIYHIGLDVKNVGGTLLKEFTDGTKWDDCEMGNLYMEVNPYKCPTALYSNLEGAELTIEKENFECDSNAALARYICLEPAGKKENSVASSDNLVQQSSGGFNLTSAIGGAAFVAVFVFAAVGWRKVKSLEKIIERNMKKEELM